MRLLLIPFIALPAALHAQAPTERPVRWTAEASFANPDKPAQVTLAADIASGWHIYALTQGLGGPVPMRILLDRGQGVAFAGPLTPPRAKVTFDSTFRIATEAYRGKQAFIVPLRTLGATPPAKVNLRVRYQACSSTFCMPARTETVPVRIVSSAR